ncbi:thioredoxin peroxidase DOT5 KNAG_0G01020 [Huiozyma naganishii CBS 8797]|uniref:thioredoxin-dependent peroxiredoxin n=1 Tax=Huiozyma naganishii (strain ATCC MYA-139 / BCRC 22969 / CBS 8797 / KCTC 17520 / NBRC 10181 / NCYC 3082 / Yp74L-3) TaxID=1071383 RepID=J7R8G2_HUIN7|nr:hypothetical protein KNAG_0G01020 [Kazachstania naganishii CBS 8797]CCK71160.1 hypothetical protein KNAG_0G01020 [Kazachstania naganishii CBS 8797]
MVELRKSARVANIKKQTTLTTPATSNKIVKKTSNAASHKKVKIVAETEDKPLVDAKVLEIGDEIPDLTLVDQEGELVSLTEVASNNKILVIFAYPRASTPGCTRQACGFRDNYAELKKHAAVYGLSADTVASQKKFQTKQNLPYNLLSDPKREFIGVLGAKKTSQSGIIRSYWIFFNGKLRIKKIKVSPEASVAESKAEVLELVKEL